MKLFALAALLSTITLPALAAEVHCADAAGKLTLTMTVPAGLGKGDLERSAEVREARVHIDAEFAGGFTDEVTIDDEARGGLQWSDFEGGAAVRTKKGDHLVSIRTGAFNAEGVATGRFEDGAGPRLVPATCRWID
jgi:hypothetical protein